MENKEIYGDLQSLSPALRKLLYDLVSEIDFDGIKKSIEQDKIKGEDVGGYGYTTKYQNISFVTDGNDIIYYILIDKPDTTDGRLLNVKVKVSKLNDFIVDSE